MLHISVLVINRLNFPLDVLDEIWDLIESVSEGFLTYSLNLVMFSSFRLLGGVGGSAGFDLCTHYIEHIFNP